MAPVANDDEGCMMAELEESGSRECMSLTPRSGGGNKRVTVAPDGAWVEAALGVEWVMAAPETYGDSIRTEVAIDTGNTSNGRVEGVTGIVLVNAVEWGSMPGR